MNGDIGLAEERNPTSVVFVPVGNEDRFDAIDIVNDIKSNLGLHSRSPEDHLLEI